MGRNKRGLFGILSLDSGKHPQTPFAFLRVSTMPTHIICAGCGNISPAFGGRGRKVAGGFEASLGFMRSSRLA